MSSVVSSEDTRSTLDVFTHKTSVRFVQKRPVTLGSQRNVNLDPLLEVVSVEKVVWDQPLCY